MKVVSKVRLLFLFISLGPLVLLLAVTQGRLLQYPLFDTALALAVSTAILVSFLTPDAAARFLVLKSLHEIHLFCERVKQGDYLAFSLPNQGACKDDENEIQLLMRDLNWMLHQIELRETKLKVTIGQLSEAKSNLLAQKEALAVTNRRLAELAMSDSLTGLANRRHFFDHLESALYQKSCCIDAVALLILDIDHFKKVNDAFGHQAGDAVLVDFSQLLLTGVRQGDLPARIGGEEFAVLLVGTGLREALGLAGRIHKMVQNHSFTDGSGRTIAVTCSIGVCCFPQMDLSDIPKLYSMADQALYAAKGAGRNQIFYIDLTPEPHTVRFA
ncbi:MAG: GGDEF domain-containing protein [Sporomusaceae bacterium]|nr:GGDEF domain-containing protein [Sporomusaceae bacterium]